MEDENIGTLAEDRNIPGVYRVEGIGDDGGVDVAVFSGPNALDSAIIFAGAYYGSWDDPHALAGH